MDESSSDDDGEDRGDGKLWWGIIDGQNKMGRCGPNGPKKNGKEAICNPNSDDPCCSEYGFCGHSDGHCKCPNCVDYREKKEKNHTKKNRKYDDERDVKDKEDDLKSKKLDKLKSKTLDKQAKTTTVCTFCTTKLNLDRAVTNQLLKELSVVARPMDLEKILKLLKLKDYSNVRYRAFDKYCELYNFLESLAEPGMVKYYALGFYRSLKWGNFYGLNVWRNAVTGQLETRLIDMSKQETSPMRVQSNMLPDGTSHLFELNAEPDANFKYIKDPAFLNEKSNLSTNEWLHLTEIYMNNRHAKLPLFNMLSFVSITKRFVRNVDSPDDENEGEELQRVSCESPVLGKPRVSVCRKRIIGYYTSWITGAKFNAEQAQLLTHVIYSFFPMNEDHTIDDSLPEDATARLKDLFLVARLVPHLKVMFAIGGWENSQYFSEMAASDEKRTLFIDSVIWLVNKWDFDGIDIDWEHPVSNKSLFDLVILVFNVLLYYCQL